MEIYDVDQPEPFDPFKLAFIFKDISCTIPANKDLCIWLLWMFNNNQEDLRFLHQASQEYVSYGGGSKYTWKQWKHRLETNLNKCIAEYK